MLPTAKVVVEAVVVCSCGYPWLYSVVRFYERDDDTPKFYVRAFTSAGFHTESLFTYPIYYFCVVLQEFMYTHLCV